MSQRWLTAAGSILVLSLWGPQGAAQEQVHFDSASGDRSTTRLSGYLYRPRHAGPSPAAVLMHGCAGLYHRRTGKIAAKMHAWAEFLREQGYVVLLVDSFSPRGLDEICTKRTKLNSARSRSYDAYGGLMYLQSLAFVSADRIALMGWSNGARAVLSGLVESGRHRPMSLPHGGFRAAIAFYPQCRIKYTDNPVYRPYAPLLILIGELDDWTPAAHCVELVRTAQAAGADIEIVVYPGAHHSFDSPNSRVRYRPDVRNRNKAGGCCGATVGSSPEARDSARHQVRRFLAQHLMGGAAAGR